jgi:hypothetical protein
MGHLGGSASTEIDAPLKEVWAAVEDVITAPNWQGGLDEATALERDSEGRPTLVETMSDIKVRRERLSSASATTDRRACPGRKRRAT